MGNGRSAFNTDISKSSRLIAKYFREQTGIPATEVSELINLILGNIS